MRHKILYLSLLTTISGYSQTNSSKIIGTYNDGITQLDLRADSTFFLKTPDYVFPYTYKTYDNKGKWTLLNNSVILNPEKQKRTQSLSLMESINNSSDSIEIKINYLIEEYENDTLLKAEKKEFNLMTLYLNRKKNYHQLVREKMRRNCAFAPRIKKQYIIDSTNTIILARKAVDKIGIFTYGFDNFIELIPKNSNSNYFEITIKQQVDISRIPRNKTVIIKGKDAYFYEYNGKVSTTLNPLRKLN
jgi:hypothetical protein